ncbi:T9SS type A sorting domain-containing protein [Vicingus serpentipes]|uniref:T9SS type A sorting domain-containing protein n=1 Tax=Vicingus serpentipes TaxID=1926625 RepID=A0A5C6RYE7_9FLAO|nr:T9SS type A sorting domain-containing protein [Vicingus serpentipes]TXB66995.1 T9SS type A sorting domain-containing protein [Vicingus serpentipes]
MKKKIIPIGLFLLTASVNAQEVISTQGDSYSNGGNSIDFTIGEPVTETVSDGTNDLTQGFHQTNLTITLVEDLDLDFSVEVYPNPATDFINLSLENYNGFTLHLFDVTGKILNQSTLKSPKTSVNVSEYPKGMYLLTLTNQKDKKIKTYQIIKK